MRVDKNSDLFSNFFSNFFRKLKETEGFEFFKSDASQVEENAKAIQGNAEKPTPEGGKLMDMLKVEKPDLNEFPKNSYHIDPAKIDWESLNKIGITQEQLEKSGNLNPMLRGCKSPSTFKVSGQTSDFYLTPTDVKISFYNAPDGLVKFRLHGIQQEPQLQWQFHGYNFSSVDIKNLQEVGNMGTVAQITAPKTIGGVSLTEQQKLDFQAEKPIYLKGMVKDGLEQPYNAYIKFDRENGKPGFSRTNPDKAQIKEKIPASESRTQVAVNTDGKTNEATKGVKEPLKQGQQKPTAPQKEKQEKEQKADKPKKSKGLKM